MINEPLNCAGRMVEVLAYLLKLLRTHEKNQVMLIPKSIFEVFYTLDGFVYGNKRERQGAQETSRAY
jgi:hypothetical protein